MMKLHCHPVSPYARKAMILCRLKGIEVEEIRPDGVNGAKGYAGSDNPLGKIPALDVRPGVILFDSPVICEYLDSLKEPLLPATGDERWHQLHLHAWGDGLADAVYNYRYETVRPDELHWEQMIERHNMAMTTTIDALEADVDTLGGPWSFGNLAIICALGYMSFRAGHIDWQARAPKLARWYDVFTREPAWQETYAYDDAYNPNRN